MKNFKILRTNINIEPFLNELSTFLNYGNEWSYDRSSNLKVHQHTKHIDIRRSVFPKKWKEVSTLTRQDRLYMAADSEYHELHPKNYFFFKRTYNYLERFADELGGQLTRVMIVSLLPYTEVLPHADEGKYYTNKDRYHLPIQTKGSINQCEDEVQIYQEGELWWFNNKKIHSAKNEDGIERIHIIFDILPKKRSFLRKIRDHFEKRISNMLWDKKMLISQRLPNKQ